MNGHDRREWIGGEAILDVENSDTREIKALREKRVREPRRMLRRWLIRY